MRGRVQGWLKIDVQCSRCLSSFCAPPSLPFPPSLRPSLPSSLPDPLAPPSLALALRPPPAIPFSAMLSFLSLLSAHLRCSSNAVYTLANLVWAYSPCCQSVSSARALLGMPASRSGKKWLWGCE